MDGSDDRMYQGGCIACVGLLLEIRIDVLNYVVLPILNCTQINLKRQGMDQIHRSRHSFK